MNFHRLSLLSVAVLFSAVQQLSAAPVPTTFQSRGVGGGGALFVPRFSPHNAQELYLSCDMSEIFHSTTFGASWETLPVQEVGGNRPSAMQFTSNAQILYCLDNFSESGIDGVRPSYSADGGVTWTPLAADPTGSDAFSLFADPNRTDHLFVTNYDTLWMSTNSGASFQQRYHTSNSNAGLHIGGAFFDGANIYVGTNEGLLVSANSGSTFTMTTTPGIPAGAQIVRFCAAKAGATTRLFALTSVGGVYAGVQPEEFFYPHQSVYSIDVGQASWTKADTGLPPGPNADGNGISQIACALNDINTVWAAGQNSNELPLVYRTTNAGGLWTQVLNVATNQNVVTGWDGHLGDRQWTYGAGALGLGVSPVNSQIAAFSDLGFIHLTSNGGSSWRQGYVSQADENPAGVATPKKKSYHGVGLEDTTNWRLTWLSPTTMWACFSDICGTRSTDNGASWSFNYSGHSLNSSYDCVVQPVGGKAYLATGSVHDMYQTTRLTDSLLDAAGAQGGILVSTTQGLSWSTIHDFGHVVFGLALDPTNTERMYALVVHSTQGGIWRTNNLSAGSGSTWTRLTQPTRTQGHPFSLKVLVDGTLVATFSGRRTTAFTQSSGVFVSTNDGVSWTDRSDPNMTYYVKDLVVDPFDANQNTWCVGVWSGYGGPLTTNNQAGGLYRTTDRGVHWTRILTKHRVTSCAYDPYHPGAAYVTTETDGLWHTDEMSAATPAPVFTRVDGYPFRQPERVYFDPYDETKVWVTSFGNGTRVGIVPAANLTASGWMLSGG
ncbi:sialidase family protein [soil metagenome]